MNDGHSGRVALEAIERSRLSRRTCVRRTLTQPLVERFAIHHADEAAVDRHVDPAILG